MSGATLEDKFKKLEQGQGQSDALLALKQKMGLLPTATMKPAPALSADEFAVPDIGIDLGDKQKAH